VVSRQQSRPGQAWQDLHTVSGSPVQSSNKSAANAMQLLQGPSTVAGVPTAAIGVAIKVQQQQQQQQQHQPK